MTKLCVVIYDITETGSVDNEMAQHCDTWTIDCASLPVLRAVPTPAELVDFIADQLSGHATLTIKRGKF